LTAFYDADVLILTTSMRRRGPIEGVEAGKLFEGIRDYGHKDVSYFPGKKRLLIISFKRSTRDIVITLGAGDIWQVADELVKRLEDGSES